MAIPQYERQVKPAPVPGVMAPGAGPLSAYGGGDEVAKAFGSAGALASDAAALLLQKAKEAKDEIEMGQLSGAAAKLAALQTRLLHDPKDGALNQQGENSFATYEPTMASFKKGADEIEGDLTSPELKARFRNHVNNSTSQMDQSLQVHISGQRKQYVATNLTGAAEEYANAAEANALTNPNATRTNILLQRGELLKLAKVNGLSVDATKALLADQESKTQARIINLMLAKQQDMTAKAYYDSLPANTLRNDEAVQVAHALEIGSIRGESQRLLAQIVNPKPVTTLPGESGIIKFVKPTEKEAWALVKTIEDPKLQDATRDRLRQYYEDQERVDLHDRNDAITEAGQYVLQTGKMDDVPPELMERMKATDVAKLMELASKIRSGEHISTDPLLFHELMQQARDPKTRQDFLDRNLLADYGKLSVPDRKHFEEMQTKLKNEDPKSATMLNFHERVEKTLLANNKISDEGSKLKGDELKRYAQFSMSADARIRAFERDELKGQRAANPKEQQTVIEQMMQEKSEDSTGFGWWSNPILGGAILKDEVTVPDPLKASLTIYLKSNGKAADPDKLKRMYRAMMAQDRAQFDRIVGE